MRWGDAEYIWVGRLAGSSGKRNGDYDRVDVEPLRRKQEPRGPPPS